MNSANSLVNTDLSLTYVLGDADGFLDFLKANGLKAGKKPVAELLAGKRDEVAGFYLVAADEPVEPVDEVVVVDELVVDEVVALAPTAEVAPAPTAAAADEKPAFSDDAVAAAVAEALAAGAPVVTEKPADAAPAPAAKVKAPKLLKAVTPVGKVKPVRKGTKIANCLELLLAGVTAEALLGAAVSDDLVDFCNRRVTKRGYGIALEGDLIKLVLPAGATSVAYSG